MWAPSAVKATPVTFLGTLLQGAGREAGNEAGRQMMPSAARVAQDR